MSREEGGRRELARAIADGEPIDWDEESDALSAQEIAAFRTLELMRRLQADEARIADLSPEAEIAVGFDVKEKIGRGAYSDVYRAIDRALRRDVALKVLKEGVPLTAADRARFLKEARALASLRHPNIVTVHAIDEVEGRPRLCLELVEGRTLAEVMREEGPFSLERTLAIAQDLCGALALMHEHGLAHRDIKPSNVMIDARGRAVLLDFGLAHSIGPADLADGLSGTPLVMAPEQLTPGACLGPAVDIYAVGVLLYWMVTGKFPIEADTFTQLRDRVLRGDVVPLAECKIDLPGCFTDAVHRCMETTPARRFDSARQLGDALAQIRADQSTPGDKRRRSRRVAVGSIPALLLVLLSGYFWFTFRGGMTTAARPRTGERIPASCIIRIRTAGGRAPLFPESAIQAGSGDEPQTHIP
ncbi:MAG: serine/threonine-protein kinase [Planctomycetota bacterium]